MAKFVFELEAVLKLRRSVERTRQLAVAQLERERLAVEARIRAYQDQITAERRDLRQHLDSQRGPAAPSGAGRSTAQETFSTGVDLAAVRLQVNTSLHLVAKAHHEVLKLAGVHHRLDAARLELLGATTDRKAVEVLRTRRYEAWMFDQRRRESIALDEINTMRAAHREEAA